MKTLSTLLTQEQVQRTHEASLEILAEVGLIVRNDKALAIFSENGCEVDTETLVVKFPASVVEHFRKMMPPTFTFRGRDPQFDRTIPDDSPVIVTASSTPDIMDPVTGKKRRATSDDIARIAHLINELPGYDIFSISTLADDAPLDQFTISRLYPALKNCLKPVRSTATDVEDAEKVLRLASIIAGGNEAYRKHPFITHHFCPIVSPLTFDHDSTELLIYFVEQGLPVYPSIVPNGGLTSPMTLAGTLVQGNAEFLAAAALMQMVVPNTPLIYSTLPTMADLRTGAYASGGIECGMLHMACAQMSHFYNVPSGGYIGLTNSKINDSQAGYETGLSTMGGLLAGADMFNMGGLLDALMAFDFAKAVIDDEIAQMLKRVKRGMEFSEENLALDVIADAGPGGDFLTHPHTMKFMRTGALLPKIANRETYDDWQQNGKIDTHTRAMQQAREILERENTAIFSPEIEQKIRAEFDNLVAGDLKLPEGW